jgi:hypothetical protein
LKAVVARFVETPTNGTVSLARETNARIVYKLMPNANRFIKRPIAQ